MDNSSKDNIDSTIYDDDDSSGYIRSDSPGQQMDFGGLFSHRFSNIKLIYTSPLGPTEIYTATRYGKRFILKALKEQYRNDPILTMGLAKEFEIGIQLDHPNIRRTLGLETVEGLGKVIVLEYIDGCSLARLIDSGDIKNRNARTIVAQIADAIAYMHGKQVFHRDIKPSNILVTHQGNVAKVIDFNLSDSDEFIILKNPAGSVKYMAPELFEPGARPSAEADIYSLGIVFDEIAIATHDDDLARVAQRCTVREPARRPLDISRIKLPGSMPSAIQKLHNFLSSKALTYFMICLCLALAATIIYLSFYRLS